MADKYDQQLKDLAAAGKAMTADDGTVAYPIADKDDLSNAIHAVGRGKADHDIIRLHIIKQAKALDAEAEIPANWNADGSLKDAGTRAATQTCSLCDGTGTILDGNRKCPDCDGAGEVKGSKRTRSRTLVERRRALHTGREIRRTFTFVPGQPAGGFRVHRAATVGAEPRGDTVVTLVGTPIRYGTPYDVNDRYGTFSEEIRSGACADTLVDDGTDPAFLFDHAGLPLGRQSNSTLRLGESVRGLGIEVDLDTRQQVANDLAIAVERGDVYQMSIGFMVDLADEEWDSTATVRKINRLTLFDVSAVTFPASPTTTIGVAAEPAVDGIRRLVRSLRRFLPAEVTVPAELRVMSQSDCSAAADALDALHDADDFAIPAAVIALQHIDQALDEAMSALSSLSGVPDPDGDPDDLEPALTPPAGDATDADEEMRTRQRQRLQLARARMTVAA